MATVAEIQQEIARLQAEAATYQSRIAALRQDLDRATPGARPRITQALGIQEQGLRDLQNQILSLQRQLATAQAAQPAPPPARSAGQAVQADQQGGPLETTSPPSNIPPGYRGAVTNADGEVVAYVGANGEWEYVGDGTVAQAGVPISGAPQNETASDDAGPQGANSTDPAVQQQLQNQGAQTAESKAGIYIFPQSNILDNFASYTWSASLYMLTDTQFKVYTKFPQRNINSYLLLLQSGGAPQNIGGAKQNMGSGENLYEPRSGQTAGRNPYFGEDFYIDNIEIQTLATQQKGHGGQQIKFQVTETENISFLDKLYAAAQNIFLNETVTRVNYASVYYVMVIRFYGYDENGQPIQIKSSGAKSDPLAVVEKYIPFKLQEVQFRVKGRDVVYDIKGVPFGHDAGMSTGRASIPADIELTGQTVKDILVGDVVYSGESAAETNPAAGTTASQPSTSDNAQNDRELNRAASQAPAKAPAAKSKVSGMRGGLISIMNQVAEQFRKNNNFDLADQYELRFADDAAAIRDASITKDGNKTNKARVAMSTAASENTQNASPDKQAMDPTTRNYGITAGMQLIQAIELIIRQSNYINDQAALAVDETTNKFVPNPAAKKSGEVDWFYIECLAEPIGYDKKRNDFAVKMIYLIRPYRITNLLSPYFKIPLFPGVHKKYPYWFTGQNTAVLDYEAKFDHNFMLLIAGNGLDNDLQKQQQVQISSYREMVRIQGAGATGQTRQGAEGRANEISASAAEYLYAPTSVGETKLKIIGDPSWIAQGEYTGAVSPASTKKTPFLPDGTINFAEGQPIFEIVWQRPGPRDLTTGLQDPYWNDAARKQGGFGDPIQSIVYTCRSVTSIFRGGLFEQVLDAILYQFPKPDNTNAATAPAAKTPTGYTESQLDADNPPRAETDAATSAREDARESSLAALLLPTTGGATPAPTISPQTSPSDTGVDSGGNNVGILLRDETGQASTLRINPETGELYNATGLPAPPRAPSAAQQENQDALARYVKEIGAQDPESVNPIQAPNPPAPDVYGQVMNRET